MNGKCAAKMHPQLYEIKEEDLYNVEHHSTMQFPA